MKSYIVDELLPDKNGRSAVMLDSDLEGAGFARQGDDLLITAADGGQTVLKNFFSSAHADEVDVILPDGEIVNIVRLLESEGPESIRSALLHPSSSSSSYASSGVHEYRQGAGQLISGVEDMDSLPKFRFPYPKGHSLKKFLPEPSLKGDTDKAYVWQETVDTGDDTPPPAPPPAPSLDGDDDTITLRATAPVKELILLSDSTPGVLESAKLLAHGTKGPDVIDVAIEHTDTGSKYVVGGNIGGDQVWGNDSITLELKAAGADGVTISDSYIDSGKGDDTITILVDSSIINSSMTNVSITGGEGADRIIFKDTDLMGNGLYIGGDVGLTMTGGQGSAGDSIFIRNLSSGSGPIEGGPRVGGDAGFKLSSSHGGDRDSISVTNLAGGYIGGDAGEILENHSVGGNQDLISVSTFSGGFLGGDAGGEMTDSTGGSGDTIDVGIMSGGFIGGDAGQDMINAQGGSGDFIHVGNMGAGFVGGDAGASMAGSTGGNDSIQIDTFVSGAVAGDAGTSMTSSFGGNDAITINSMSGGAVYGDAATFDAASHGGNDVILIKQMSGGSVYGDAGTVAAGAQSGDDTITVQSLEGSAAKLIDGGDGYDVFVYEDSTGHALTLNEDGELAIAEHGGADITLATNTTIRGFEGLGGGSGDDSLFGNSQNNILIGGLGDDTLTGGLGADTFLWLAGEAGGSHDVITDFSLSDGDKIDLSSLLDIPAGSSNSDYLTIGRDGSGNAVIHVSTTGNIGSGYDLTITLDNTQHISDLHAIMNQIFLQG